MRPGPAHGPRGPVRKRVSHRGLRVGKEHIPESELTVADILIGGGSTPYRVLEANGRK
jgi:hypothetical protein